MTTIEYILATVGIITLLFAILTVEYICSVAIKSTDVSI